MAKSKRSRHSNRSAPAKGGKGGKINWGQAAIWAGGGLAVGGLGAFAYGKMSTPPGGAVGLPAGQAGQVYRPGAFTPIGAMATADQIAQAFFRLVPLPQNPRTHIDCTFWMGLTRLAKQDLVRAVLTPPRMLAALPTSPSLGLQAAGAAMTPGDNFPFRGLALGQIVSAIDAYCLKLALREPPPRLPHSFSGVRPGGLVEDSRAMVPMAATGANLSANRLTAIGKRR